MRTRSFFLLLEKLLCLSTIDPAFKTFQASGKPHCVASNSSCAHEDSEKLPSIQEFATSDDLHEISDANIPIQLPHRTSSSGVVGSDGLLKLGIRTTNRFEHSIEPWITTSCAQALTSCTDHPDLFPRRDPHPMRSSLLRCSTRVREPASFYRLLLSSVYAAAKLRLFITKTSNEKVSDTTSQCTAKAAASARFRFHHRSGKSCNATQRSPAICFRDASTGTSPPDTSAS